MAVSEKYTVSEQHNAGTGERTIQLDGQSFTSWRGYSNDAVVRAQEDIMGLADQIVAVAFEDKTEHNGYYQVRDVGTEILYWPDDSIRSFNWSFILHKFGPDNAVDVESRVGTIVRSNNFVLTGERWQAPPIGHYAYYTGSTPPSGSVSRTGSDGAITVYRTIPAAVNPRYGCPVAAYPVGRARILIDSYERTGMHIRAAATTWELNNGLVRVRPLTANGMLSVDSWGGTAWETKAWHIAKGGATTSLGTFDQATIIRNDFEMVTLRLVRNGSPGRTYVDLTLRRGSRFVEVFIQSDSSATLGAYLETVETASDQTATGYVVASANDADGNKYIVGSSKTVAYTANRGISKAAVTQLDVYIGSVVNGTGAVAGDAATDIRNQYIGAVSESTTVVKR
jgi:flavin-binding protein dodecin